MKKLIQISVTAPDKNTALKIGRSLVEKKLVSCMQITGPIQSIYWWNNEIEDQEEYLCLAKTREDLFEAVKNEVYDLHPYEVPEIIAVPILLTSKDYGRWIEEYTTGE